MGSDESNKAPLTTGEWVTVTMRGVVYHGMIVGFESLGTYRGAPESFTGLSDRAAMIELLPSGVVAPE